MNAFHRGACAAAVVLTLACANVARAQTTFYTDNTVIGTAVTGDVVVGHNSSQTVQSSPTVILAPGVSITHDVQVFNGSAFTTSGSIGGSLSAYNNATATVLGGTLEYNLFADNDSTVNIKGGTFSRAIDAFNNSVINVSGGTFSNIYAFDNSVINFAGSLSIMLTDPNFGYQGAYNQYTVTGTFGNSTTFTSAFLNIVKNSSARYTNNGSSTQDFTPVPEPGSVALLVGLGVTGAGFAARRRRQRA